ncbi:hypothetical protein SDJN03_01475, partial [Cucurbita argyrosperma subsp. sororia]
MVVCHVGKDSFPNLCNFHFFTFPTNVRRLPFLLPPLRQSPPPPLISSSSNLTTCIYRTNSTSTGTYGELVSPPHRNPIPDSSSPSLSTASRFSSSAI